MARTCCLAFSLITTLPVILTLSISRQMADSVDEAVRPVRAEVAEEVACAEVAHLVLEQLQAVHPLLMVAAGVPHPSLGVQGRQGLGADVLRIGAGVHHLDGPACAARALAFSIGANPFWTLPPSMIMVEACHRSARSMARFVHWWTSALRDQSSRTTYSSGFVMLIRPQQVIPMVSPTSFVSSFCPMYPAGSTLTTISPMPSRNRALRAGSSNASDVAAIGILAVPVLAPELRVVPHHPGSEQRGPGKIHHESQDFLIVPERPLVAVDVRFDVAASDVHLVRHGRHRDCVGVGAGDQLLDDGEVFRSAGDEERGQIGIALRDLPQQEVALIEDFPALLMAGPFVDENRVHRLSSQALRLLPRPSPDDCAPELLLDGDFERLARPLLDPLHRKVLLDLVADRRLQIVGDGGDDQDLLEARLDPVDEGEHSGARLARAAARSEEQAIVARGLAQLLIRAADKGRIVTQSLLLGPAEGGYEFVRPAACGKLLRLGGDDVAGLDYVIRHPASGPPS